MDTSLSVTASFQAGILRALSRAPELGLRSPLPPGLRWHRKHISSRRVGSLGPGAQKELATPATQGPPTGDKFLLIYRFPGIKLCGSLSRLKVLQTAVTVLLLPPGIYLYSRGLLPPQALALLGGGTSFALAMLCWISFFLRRLVGLMYVNEAGTVLRVAHLTFWGRRRDTLCPVASVVPLSEGRDRPRDLFVRLQRYDGGQTFYFTLRFGRVLDRRRFGRVFGPLDRGPQ
ncbi:transmembrane protein 186 [Tachyglossus aculeatus]|uniref:transmembrane protein 186 n=1 Tax=Tachyglossus aculeatus TaxID=9261 RepID=UPI0018F6A6A5|nr:transmembrane protein 186 [Tachyglossus aculeatus]